ncbi:MAG: UDP-glucose/GDP-mannose dehydrogenase family protein [Planctomycetes bacterium]|nr:UDP-glucose/GDP-mannose dehydrogenase family protein [Planctomycetota bacterium]
MRIAILGSGYVGLVSGTCFAHLGHRVTCLDNDVAKIDTLRAGRMPIFEPGLAPLVKQNAAAGRLDFSTDIAGAVESADVIFIAVGTPPTASGAADLSYIEAVSRIIAQHLKRYKVIVEKSTVPVQTGERVRQTIRKYVRRNVPFDVCSNPEFLREGSAVQDFLHPDRLVLGVESRRAERLLRQLYKPLDAEIVITDIKSAELIKHASNSFLALKISYINAVANVCELAGANVVEVARGMGMDSRIGSRFLSAGLGYGGSCFPKDVEAFAKISAELGAPFPLLEEVQRINSDQRRRFVQKIEKELWVLKGKTVAVLGLSFKPNTDDVRDAPAIAICRELISKGAQVRAYDPRAAGKARMLLPDVHLCDSAYQAIRGADCLALCTEWEEFHRLDLGRVRRLMSHPTVVDGRNFFDPEAMRKRGFTYVSMGRA